MRVAGLTGPPSHWKFRCMAMTPKQSDTPLLPEASAIAAAACLLHGFSDRSRLAIVQHLLLGEHRVVDLTGHLDLAQSTVSKHLACLVDCGIAQVRPQGRASMYSLSHPEATLGLLAAAEKLLGLTGHAPTASDPGTAELQVVESTPRAKLEHA